MASIATFNAVIRAHLGRHPPDVPAAAALYARAVALSTAGGLGWYAPDGRTYTLLIDGAARAAAAAGGGTPAASAAVAVADAVIADAEAAVRGGGLPPAAATPAVNAYIKALRVGRAGGGGGAGAGAGAGGWGAPAGDPTPTVRGVLDRLAGAGIPPDVVTFNSLLDVAASAVGPADAAAGLSTAVWVVRVAMPAARVVPDRRTYNTLIKACGRVGVGAVGGGGGGGAAGGGAGGAASTAALAIAHDALHRLRGAGWAPDDFTYQAMVAAAAVAGDATRALHYLRRAERRWRASPPLHASTRTYRRCTS
ncbi:hypothetical protein BU14_0404s0016 [Porphyra umbilicalis]|uniref:Pentacotripeptide-repeat region of PRORP domain-containing protein n=1 Tax=Porphyra umbilicalis TaxID=2786 RepID=A0A1X6NVY6_PORUM|nr:hypothetical protein BU14_0404s0016 [Porphyra umbilicalis]|eukprot:OSX72789.1 hypothetical protein BU14_0404s0016 [Porphyra umbilicalis]